MKQKQKAYFTTPLITLADVANTTGTPLSDLFEKEKTRGSALFDEELTPQSALPWVRVQKICQEIGYQAEDHRFPAKTLSKDQKSLARSAANFHGEYADIHRASQQPAGIKIAAIHEILKESILEGLQYLEQTKNKSLKNVEKALRGCLEFHQKQQNLHERIQDKYSRGMEAFHRQTSRAIEKGIDKTLTPIHSPN